MLPTSLHHLTSKEIRTVAEKCRRLFLDCAKHMNIDNDLEPELVNIYIPLAAALIHRQKAFGATPVIGINGAQGSGKSTLCKLLTIVLKEGFSKHVATLSIDDLYLTSTERKKLASTIHPLLATRGVPGTHDVNLGLSLLGKFRKLTDKQTINVPVFDKSQDDRLPTHRSRKICGPVDLILFEGWCVGARPQQEEALCRPVNSLEKEEDPDQSWRRYVNEQLQNDYQKLFNELDMLIMLKVPGMASVMKWRSLQEEKLAKATAHGAHKLMDTPSLQRFIMHYERLTQHMLTEIPVRADIVYELNDEHQFAGTRVNLDNN